MNPNFGSNVSKPAFGLPAPDSSTAGATGFSFGQTAAGSDAGQAATSAMPGFQMKPPTSAPQNFSFSGNTLGSGGTMNFNLPASTSATPVFNLSGTTAGGSGFNLAGSSNTPSTSATPGFPTSSIPSTAAPSFSGGLSLVNPAATSSAPAGFALTGATTSAPTGFSLTGAASSAPTGFSLTGATTSAPTGFSLTGATTSAPTGFPPSGATTAASTGFSLGGTTTSAATGFPLGGATSTAATGFPLSSTTTTTGSTGLTGGLVLGGLTSTANTTGSTTFSMPLTFGQGATSLATTTTTATSSAPTAGTGGTVSNLNFGQLEETINKWTMDLEEQEKLFMNQATQVNAWDHLLTTNGEKIVQLNEAVEAVKVEQQQLNHELDFILSQQRELEDCLVPLEKELASTAVLDPEREHTYELAETMDTQLKQMSEDLREIIEYLNENNRSQDSSDPLVQIGRILNAHMNSLQWIDQNTAVIQNHLDQVVKLHESHRRDNERSFHAPYN